MKKKLRMTPQTIAVLEATRQLGHASNHGILQLVRQKFPKLSATTVHRITLRLIANGILAKGPEINGVRLIDANTSSHDHFLCSGCDGIKDVQISSKTKSLLVKEIKVEVAPSNFVIFGDCSNCR